MRRKTLLLTGFIVLTACVPATLNQSSNPMQLTLYMTSTSENIPTAAATAMPQATAVPAPTATPMVHIVALGETISSIALRYGLDMSAVLAANPDINPNMLIVGTEVIIPIGNTSAHIGSVLEPLDLEVDSPKCAATFEEGLWCLVPVSNPLNQAAASVTISVVLNDPGGETSRKVNVPLLMDKIEPGQSIPAVIYFEPPAPDKFTASATLVSALPVSESGQNFLPTTIVNDQIELKGQSAQVSGEVEIDGETGSAVVMHVTAIGYDAGGKPVGARRTEMKTTLETGNAIDFNLNLYSFSDAIASVTILAEAYQDQS